MVCVIPLAQTFNRTAGCSPFQQLIARCRFFGNGAALGNMNPRLTGGEDIPRLILWQMRDPKRNQWTRILVLLNKGIR